MSIQHYLFCTILQIGTLGLKFDTAEKLGSSCTAVML
jgi:hypothetical protein